MEITSHIIKNRALRIVVIIAAWILLLLGVLGILLPIIPTAVFIFISAGLFAKSSPRLYTWLVHNKVFGKYVVKYHQKRDFPFALKLFSIIFLNMSIGYTTIFVVHNLFLRFILILFALSISIYILSIRSRQHPAKIFQVDET
ncbi:MAG: YbaN family protein [Syntrophothermus sp.]